MHKSPREINNAIEALKGQKELLDANTGKTAG